MAGQQELFDNANDDDGDDSDVEMDDASELGSDVEVVNGSDDDDDNDSPEDDDDEEEEPSPEDADELAEFDAKLIAALGDHSADKDADADTSDGEDMNDDDMEALDEQLVKVFKARAQTSNKKRERKDAKETMINFKNRVLDLLEIYVKKSHSQPAAIVILMPLLQLTRRTKTAQLASKASSVLRDYTKACKGAAVPDVESDEAIWPLLRAVHQEAMRSGPPGSHTPACSQASLLLVKILVKHDKESIGGIVDVYAETRKEQLVSTKCHVQPAFFTEWNNWCVSAGRQLKG